MRQHTMSRFDEEIEEPFVLGDCEGCGLEVYEGDEHFDYQGDLIHNDASCVMEYFENMAILKAN